MKTFPHLIICEHCDTVHKRQALDRDETARCGVCATPLYHGNTLQEHQLLALTCAAAIVFVLANVYPVIQISYRGLHGEATLWQAVVALMDGPVAPIAVPMAMTVILIPLAQIALLGWVLGFSQCKRRAPGAALAIRCLKALRPWSMVEVGLLGALVTVVKLSGYLSVIPGVGLWALAALMVLLVVIAGREPEWFWQKAEQA